MSRSGTSQEPWRDELTLGFDKAAALYDDETIPNASMAYMRRVSLDVLLETFSPGDKLLEIGCGSGGEAIALARRGMYIEATDLSAEMVRITSGKAQMEGVSGRVSARQLSARDLETLVGKHHAGPAGSRQGLADGFVQVLRCMGQTGNEDTL